VLDIIYISLLKVYRFFINVSYITSLSCGVIYCSQHKVCATFSIIVFFSVCLYAHQTIASVNHDGDLCITFRFDLLHNRN